MDLASGYSDSTNYGNGYTPLANNAINNNNLAYNANQNYANMAGMYNPFAQSGGFGAMTDYYSGLGRDYTTATGGNIFGNASGGGGSNPYSYDDSAGLNSSTAPRGGAGDYFNWEMSQLNNTYTQPALSRAPQVEPYNPGSNSQAPTGGWGGAPANPNMQALLGYTPQQLYSGGGIGSDTLRDQFAGQIAQNHGGAGDYFNWEMSQQQRAPTQTDPFWQSLRDYTGMGQPGQQQPAWNPWGNTGQIGVTDPLGYGTGGYQGNAIPTQTPVQQQQQPNNLPWFWQSIRDLAGADPKDQSRLPQDNGGYPGATNPNYQPGGMTPQLPYQPWNNAS
jgi:hypothetical protein